MKYIGLLFKPTTEGYFNSKIARNEAVRKTEIQVDAQMKMFYPWTDSTNWTQRTMEGQALMTNWF
jgi:hypothetical protein